MALSPPPHPKAHVDTGLILARALGEATTALLQHGRFEEADHMAERGLTALPNDRDLLVQHALSAQKAGRSTEAIERWRRAVRAAPGDAMCLSGLAASLREAGDYAAAQTAVDEGLRQFPQDLAFVAEAARLAGCTGQYRAALGLWQTAIATPNPDPDWLEGHARTLLYLGEFDEAEAALSAALADFPKHLDLQALEALVVSARDEGSRRVRLATEGYKGDRQHTGPEAVAQPIAMRDPLPVPSSLASQTLVPLSVEPLRIEDEELKQLLLHFESLGDNCELGLVQRRYLAEPLGLLRWSTVTLDELIPALGQRLQGMGEEANTQIVVASNGEFFMRDTRWSLRMHTFQFDGEANKNVLYNRICRRITYLRDKLLSDLAEAEKIFVYASAGLDGDQMEMLHRALRVFGPVKMLAVQPVASSPIQGSCGDIAKIDKDRFVGFLGRPGRDATGAWDVAFEDWVSICRKTAEAK